MTLKANRVVAFLSQTCVRLLPAGTCAWRGATRMARLPHRDVSSRKPAAIFQLDVPVPCSTRYKLDGKAADFSPENTFRAISSSRSKHLLNRELTVFGFSLSERLISS